MIKLTNLVNQSVAPGETVTFSTIIRKSGRAECFREGTGSVKLCCTPATYEVQFSANVTADEAGFIQLAFALEGDALPESLAGMTIGTAGEVNHISIPDLINNTCCDFDRISVKNVGTIPVVVYANPLLYVKRIS